MFVFAQKIIRSFVLFAYTFVTFAPNLAHAVGGLDACPDAESIHSITFAKPQGKGSVSLTRAEFTGARYDIRHSLKDGQVYAVCKFSNPDHKISFSRGWYPFAFKPQGGITPKNKQISLPGLGSLLYDFQS